MGDGKSSGPTPDGADEGFELLHPDAHGDHPGIRERRLCNPFGQSLGRRYMVLGDDAAHRGGAAQRSRELGTASNKARPTTALLTPRPSQADRCPG